MCNVFGTTMNVGLYSATAGMRIGQDYQQMLSENLAMQSVPGYRQSIPVFSTDPTMVSDKAAQTPTGSTAAVHMTRVYDFSQGQLSPSGSPYHLAIQGNAFFEVREANGKTTYTRNGSFHVTSQGNLITSDGATVLGNSGAPITIDTSKGGDVSIGKDGTISINGEAQGRIGTAHFDNPTASLQGGGYGRFTSSASAAKQGLDKNDQIMQGSLEESNGNPVEEMSSMIQAVRLYEANQKSIQAVDENQNQLITNLGTRPTA
jgi:flagellar basal body rod protein FlgG